MENSFETSFIPQQPLVRTEGVPRRSEPVNIALILALVIFFITVTVAGGIYFYKLQVDKRILSKEKQLQAEEKNLNIDEINAYKHIDDKLVAVKGLLQNHSVFSTVLLLIEDSAAQNIGLTALSYQKGPTGDYVLTLSGKAPSYSAVYFQGETWRSMVPMVKSVKMGAPVADDTTGIVSFNAELTINPLYTKYSKMVETENQLNKPKEVVPSVASGTPPIVTQ